MEYLKPGDGVGLGRIFVAGTGLSGAYLAAVLVRKFRITGVVLRHVKNEVQVYVMLSLMSSSLLTSIA